MKKYLFLIVFFNLMSCVAISYEPVTHPDQRIIFEGISFLPPKGDNWKVTSDVSKRKITHYIWGRATTKLIGFRKSIIELGPESSEAELWQVWIQKLEFEIMKFDSPNNLKEYARLRSMDLERAGMVLLGSSYSHKKFHEMNCVRRKSKVQRDPTVLTSKSSTDIKYSQGYICVHPKNPQHLILFFAEQLLSKGRTPTEFQTEIDPFFNSVEVH
jgi:hypothetical protein